VSYISQMDLPLLCMLLIDFSSSMDTLSCLFVDSFVISSQIDFSRIDLHLLLIDFLLVDGCPIVSVCLFPFVISSVNDYMFVRVGYIYFQRTLMKILSLKTIRMKKMIMVGTLCG